MSIKLKLIILSVFSLVVTATIGFTLFQNSVSVKKEIEKQGIVSELRKKVFEKAVLRDEYLLYREERPVIQFKVAAEALDRIFIQASNVFTSADEKVGNLNHLVQIHVKEDNHGHVQTKANPN